MTRWKLLGVALGLVIVVSASTLSIGARREAAQQPKPGKVMPSRGATLLVELGLKDSETTGWEGEIRVSEGNVVTLRAIGGGMETVDGDKWKARSQVAKKKQVVVNPVRLHATLDAPLTASVSIETSRGEFSFELDDLATGKATEFFDGQARVTRGPVSLPITDAPADDDFPATAITPDGTVWLTYVSYQHGNPIRLPTDGSIPEDWSSLVTKGHGDQVKLMRFDGSRWSEPIDVTDTNLDVWRPTVAVDGSGRVWVVWSQNMDGNWEVLARSYDSRVGEWSAVERVTTEQGADINVVAATSRSGTVWLAWMRWEGTDCAIRA